MLAFFEKAVFNCCLGLRLVNEVKQWPMCFAYLIEAIWSCQPFPSLRRNEPEVDGPTFPVKVTDGVLEGHSSLNTKNIRFRERLVCEGPSNALD